MRAAGGTDTRSAVTPARAGCRLHLDVSPTDYLFNFYMFNDITLLVIKHIKLNKWTVGDTSRCNLQPDANFEDSLALLPLEPSEVDKLRRQLLPPAHFPLHLTAGRQAAQLVHLAQRRVAHRPVPGGPCRHHSRRQAQPCSLPMEDSSTCSLRESEPLELSPDPVAWFCTGDTHQLL